MPRERRACATAGLPTGAAWRRGGVMPWASSSICRAPIDHGPTACRRTLLIAPRRKRWCLRDLLPATTRLIATDLNPPMLENRATKSLPRCRDSNRLLRATRPSWFSARRFVPPGLPCGDRSDCGRLRRMRDRTGGYWLHLSGGLIIFAIGVTDRTRTCDSQLRGQSL